MNVQSKQCILNKSFSLSSMKCSLLYQSWLNQMVNKAKQKQKLKHNFLIFIILITEY